MCECDQEQLLHRTRQLQTLTGAVQDYMHALSLPPHQSGGRIEDCERHLAHMASLVGLTYSNPRPYTVVEAVAQAERERDAWRSVALRESRPGTVGWGGLHELYQEALAAPQPQEKQAT